MFKQANKVFFIGIGGISMSALARLTMSFGIIIAGSDTAKNDLTINLEKDSTIYYGHNSDNITKFMPDLVVYTGAIAVTNPELSRAKDMGILCVERSEYLGYICNLYTDVIAVSGTHGKTTTTAMIGEIMQRAGFNPTIHVGGEVVNLGGNLVVGDKNLFITEACEYKKSFECINSTCGVVTNIECDHMDCYKNYDDILRSFNVFLDNCKVAVVNNNNPLLRTINNKIIYTFGDATANYYVDNICPTAKGFTFDVYENDVLLSNFCINIMGEYNINNALVSILVARHFGVKLDVIYSALYNFAGVKRRNELIGEIKGVSVYADYCHHPTEIAQSVANFKARFGKVLCVFQPHTYTRTKSLLKEFSVCFKGVKKLCIYPTYPAREEYMEEGSEVTLFNHIKLKNKIQVKDKKQLKQVLQDSGNYDAIIILGAGDIYDISKDIVKSINKSKRP